MHLRNVSARTTCQPYEENAVMMNQMRALSSLTSATVMDLIAKIMSRALITSAIKKKGTKQGKKTARKAFERGSARELRTSPLHGAQHGHKALPNDKGEDHIGGHVHGGARSACLQRLHLDRVQPACASVQVLQGCWSSSFAC